VPLVERVRRLYVVMRVAEDRGFAGSMQPVGIEKRMALGGEDLDVFHADAAEFVGHEVRGSLDVGLVFFERADTGDAEKILEFTEETLLIIAGKINCRRRHG
jgi:hypothetical protein